MARYCITAANHNDPNNHVASQFKLWLYNPATEHWYPQQAASAKQVVELIENGHEVFTAHEAETSITRGAPVEVELRIARNEAAYPISKMPRF